MMELSGARVETDQGSIADAVTPAVDAAVPVAKVRQQALDFAYGAQKLMLEEMVFIGNEWLDRVQTETHLLTEFVSKMAGAHSAKDLKTMFEECGQHQIDFIRRDSERLVKHGEHAIETASNLFNRRKDS